MPDALRGFLVDSLHAIRVEHPPAYRQLCAVLDGIELGVSGHGPPFALRFRRGAFHVADEVGAPEVRLVLDPSVVEALVDGDLSLLDAIVADRLRVAGSIAHLVRLHDGFAWFLAGALRAPAMISIHARWRKSLRSRHDASDGSSALAAPAAHGPLTITAQGDR